MKVTERRRTRRNQTSRELLAALGLELVGNAMQLVQDRTTVAHAQTIRQTVG